MSDIEQVKPLNNSEDDNEKIIIKSKKYINLINEHKKIKNLIVFDDCHYTQKTITNIMFLLRTIRHWNCSIVLI